MQTVLPSEKLANSLPINWKELNVNIDWSKKIPINRLQGLYKMLRYKKRCLVSGDVDIYGGKYAENIWMINRAISFLRRNIRDLEVK